MLLAVAQLVKKVSDFYETSSGTLCSQESATGHYLEPFESYLQLQIVFRIVHLNAVLSCTPDTSK